MGPKLLFVLIIVVAHGAVAAGWVHEGVPQARVAATSCVNSPGALPDFTPRQMLYAVAVMPGVAEEVMQP